MNSKFKVLSAKCKVLGAIASLLPAIVSAQDPQSWRVFPEPKFMKPEVSFQIEKAERTVLAPGRTLDREMKLFSRAEFQALSVSWQEFRARAVANAEPTLDALAPVYTANKKKVIEYATLASDQPFVASCVLAPGFLKKFENVFGPKILIAIPSRYVVYVFPALASNYREFAPMVIDAYRATPYPVTLEVFELGADGFRAVGAYHEP